jgi:hypothetical protein
VRWATSHCYLLLRVEAVRYGLELIDYSCASGLQPSEQRCVSRAARGACGTAAEALWSSTSSWSWAPWCVPLRLDSEARLHAIMEDAALEALKARVTGGDLDPGLLRQLADALDAQTTKEKRRRLLRTGGRVRAPRGVGREPCLVSDYDGGDSVDVVYDDGGEGTVEASKASSLLDFEMDESACGDASELKRRGNALFGEKDWVNAAAHYERALQVLKRPPTTGARVLINANSQLRCGTLSDVSTKTVDVMYDDGVDEDDLDRRRVILVVNDAELQCSLYLNLAKCGLKVNRLRDSTSAATLAGGLANSTEELKARFLCSARVVRGLRHALRDADVALELNASDAGALALKRDAERAKKLALRENKKLAKEVTQWVETAQGKFTENGGDAGDCAQQ